MYMTKLNQFNHAWQTATRPWWSSTHTMQSLLFLQNLCAVLAHKVVSRIWRTTVACISRNIDWSGCACRFKGPLHWVLPGRDMRAQSSQSSSHGSLQSHPAAFCIDRGLVRTHMVVECSMSKQRRDTHSWMLACSAGIVLCLTSHATYLWSCRKL